MNEIAILVPTLNRSQRIKPLAEQIHATTKNLHKVYFIVEPEDIESLKAIKEINGQFIVNGEPHTYVSAINTGYSKTSEPYIFCGSDDIEFSDGWDEKMLAAFEGSKYGFVGAVDDWKITKTGKHASHFMVSRVYIQQFSGVEDEQGVIYSNQYSHLQCDIESENVAMKRGKFKMSEAFIKHYHWFVNPQVKKDATYERASACQIHDLEVYNQRRHKFEQYLFEALFVGKVVRVNQGRLSIIVASYNAPQYLKQTIESLLKQTYHPMELIIVDNGSTNPETLQYIQELSFPTTDRITLKKIKSDPNQFVTHTWNTGIKAATGDYIAVLNNDITLSKHWDVYLMDALEDKEVLLVNPYQTDPGEMTPYGFADRAGNIHIRGTCFMFRKGFMESIGYLPEQLKLWFSDSWLAWKITQQLKKKSIFVPESIVHHFCSKSSADLEEKRGTYWWCIRGDAYAYHILTGENIDKYIQIVEARAKK